MNSIHAVTFGSLLTEGCLSTAELMHPVIRLLLKLIKFDEFHLAAKHHCHSSHALEARSG